MNIRGLYPRTDRTKVAYLSHLTAEDNAAFVALQETHLTPDVLPAEVHMEGYTMFRCDREGGRTHGGVAVYVRDDLTTREIMKYSNNYVECQVLEILELEVVLVNIYRPPNSPHQLFVEVLEKCEEALEGNKSTLMFGDYNFPFIKWPCGSIYTKEQELRSSEKEQGRLLVEWTNSHFMEQIILTPTRKENILDLVFTDTESFIQGYEIIINTKFSDHNMIKLKLNIETNKDKETDKKVNPYPNRIFEFDLMKVTDEGWVRFEKMMEAEAIKFAKETENNNTEEKLNKFYNILEEKTTFLFEVKEAFKSEEERTTKTRKNKIPKAVRALMKKKKTLSNKMLICKSKIKMVKMMKRLAQIESELSESLKKFRKKKENDAVSKIKRNPKFFYSYANKYSKVRNKVGPLLNKEEESIKDPQLMAEILKEQYESAFSKKQEEDDEQVHPEEEEEEEEADGGQQEDVELSDIVIHRGDVVEAIDMLSMWSGPGPDGVPGILLKKAKVPIAEMLLDILQCSMDAGSIPDLLKLGYICPILKPGAKREKAASWRPISLTSHVVKTWERVVRKKLVNYLEFNQFMDPDQHGSRQNRSCLSQLLEHHDEVLQMLEEGNNVDVIYSDFEKAFDKIGHEELVYKMKTHFKIKGKLLSWLKNFLENRKQQVLIEGRKSQVSKVVSGSVQGSCLGPVMFLMYIKDLTKNITANTKIFVDDAKLKDKIKTTEDVEAMQQNINELFMWENDNKMKCNSAKFQVLRYGQDQDIKDNTMYFSKNMDGVIEQFSKLRDLGVILSDDAKFSTHIDKVVKQVRQKVGWILRTFYSRKTELLKQLWKSLAQCLVDYCSQLYMPAGNSQDMQRIEKLFYDFTAKIPELKEMNYWQRLKHLKMYSQERRMERYRCIYVWKCLEGRVPACGVTAAATNERLGRRAAVPRLLPGGRMAIQTLREQSFQINGTRLFNCLPRSVRNISNQDDFKAALDQHLARVPDQPRMGGLAPEAVDQVSGRMSNGLLAWSGRTGGAGVPNTEF